MIKRETVSSSVCVLKPKTVSREQNKRETCTIYNADGRGQPKNNPSRLGKVSKQIDNPPSTLGTPHASVACIDEGKRGTKTSPHSSARQKKVHTFQQPRGQRSPHSINVCMRHADPIAVSSSSSLICRSMLSLHVIGHTATCPDRPRIVMMNQFIRISTMYDIQPFVWNSRKTVGPSSVDSVSTPSKHILKRYNLNQPPTPRSFVHIRLYLFSRNVPSRAPYMHPIPIVRTAAPLSIRICRRACYAYNIYTRLFNCRSTHSTAL